LSWEPGHLEALDNHEDGKAFMDTSEVVDRVTSAVTYLRVSVGTGPDATEWWPCEKLVADPEVLGDLARMTGAGRGADRDQVAMSLLVQAYAFRIGSIAIGAWLLGNAIIDVAPSRTAVAIGRDRPNAVRFDALGLIGAGDSLETLHATLVDGHLGPLVANAHRACRVGEALLWANVAASCASSFSAFVAPLPDRREEIRLRADAFFAAARPELARSGTLVSVGTEWAWERSACCLWYPTTGGSRCADCSLWSNEERRARYDLMVAAQSGGPTGEIVTS
jgi:ferric iron reductase protein FhuF